MPFLRPTGILFSFLIGLILIITNLLIECSDIFKDNIVLWNIIFPQMFNCKL